MNTKAQQAAEIEFPLLSKEEYGFNYTSVKFREREYSDYVEQVNFNRKNFVLGTQWQSSQTPLPIGTKGKLKADYGKDVGIKEVEAELMSTEIIYRFKCSNVNGEHWARVVESPIEDFTPHYPVPAALPVVSGGEKMYRWVKASERLPKSGLPVHLKINNSPEYVSVGAYRGKANNFHCWVDDTLFPNEIVEWLEEVSPSQLPSPVPQINELKICTVRREIEIGKKIPNSIHFNFDGGGGSTNMGSNFIDMLFTKALKKYQSEPYEFSEICRNENEYRALYEAIELNLNELGYRVEWLPIYQSNKTVTPVRSAEEVNNYKQELIERWGKFLKEGEIDWVPNFISQLDILINKSQLTHAVQDTAKWISVEGELKKIVSDKQIEKAWANANFGEISKQTVLFETLARFAQGFSSGHTAKQIVNELGLANGEKITDKGYKYLIYFEIEAYLKNTTPLNQ